MNDWNDNMSRPLTIRSSTSVVGVIGDPVRHSLSPIIHNVGFSSLGIDWVYVAFEVPAGRAPQALDAVRTLGLRGLSVTMPHKSEVARHIDKVSDCARALDSVNTIEVTSSGDLVGHSTDGDGLMSSLAASGVSCRDRQVLVLGAGGAARSVIDAVGRQMARRIVIANRSAPAADFALTLAPGKSFAIDIADVESLTEACLRSDIIINATSIGMATDSVQTALSPLASTLISSGHVVVDLVYHPLETTLLSQARAAGAMAIDGLGMLVHQAALQQHIWTGFMPDVKEMYRAASQALS